MEGKRGRTRQRQKLGLLDWMMSEGYSKLIVKRGAIGSLDLPEGRELKEEDVPQY